MSAVGPRDGQQRHMLGELRIGDGRRSFQGPLWPHERRDAEETQENQGPRRIIHTGNAVAQLARVRRGSGEPGGSGGESVVVEPQTSSPRQLDNGSRRGL
ncbi:hypothetical protein D3C73_1172290 [compost metagenome]